MKEIKEKWVYIDEIGVNVRQWLSVAEISAIVKAALKSKSWAEMQTNIDALVLHFCTDIGDENIEKIGLETLQKSGVLDDVKEAILNFYQIHDAIEYETSLTNTFAKLLPELKKAIKQNANSKK